jgi:hypothetical protein
MNKYKQLDEAERKLYNLETECAKFKREVEDLISEYEVEHFLLYGPGGIDPKEL